MNKELNKVEARQGDRRHMNMRVLFWGAAAAFVCWRYFFVLWAWSRQQSNAARLFKRRVHLRIA